MVQSAAVLIRARGVEGTSFTDVLVASGAARGSIYHYFPRGKAQLVEEATEFGGDYVAAQLNASLERGDTAGVLRDLARAFRDVLIESDFEAGCPVVAAALEGNRSPDARDTAGRAFDTWIRLIAEGLRQQGLQPEQAASVATLAVSALEGAIVLCRAQRSVEPLDRALEQVEALIRASST
jgi:TetR/AcrR family transcriptional repressor of lmrAB and yxaGH operons